jgi:hypothetical protein
VDRYQRVLSWLPSGTFNAEETSNLGKASAPHRKLAQRKSVAEEGGVSTLSEDITKCCISIRHAGKFYITIGY